MDTNLVVIMVKHSEIKENMEKLEDKAVLEYYKICNLPRVYHI